MGTIASLWRYEAAVGQALQLANPRGPAILRYAPDRRAELAILLS